MCLLHKKGHWVWVHTCGKVAMWSNDAKPLLVSGTHQDITAQKNNEQKINHLATHDSLTNLPNLRLAIDRLTMAIDTSNKDAQLTACMFVDLDGFKSINDAYGHAAGDVVLQVVSSRLLACVRSTDTVARIGGDEFVLVISGLETNDCAVLIAQKIISSVAQPIKYNDMRLSVSVSIGVSIYPGEVDSADKLIKLADDAMYISKNSGKNTYTFSK